MIKTTSVPQEYLSGIGKIRYPYGPKVEKSILEGIDEIQYLHVTPWTSIKMHGHDNQWEVWADLSKKTVYICLIGEKHELVNNSTAVLVLMAIKGHIEYSYNDLEELFHSWGFSVKHGSLEVND